MAIAFGVCCHRGIEGDSSVVVWSGLLGVVVKERREIEAVCRHCGRREKFAARSTIRIGEELFIVVALVIVYS